MTNTTKMDCIQCGRPLLRKPVYMTVMGGEKHEVAVNYECRHSCIGEVDPRRVPKPAAED